MAYRTVAIVSGASRGLGLELARALAAPETLLFALSRSHNGQLDAHWRLSGGTLRQMPVDLADAGATEQCAAALADALPRDAQRYLLINNAGTVAPIAQAADLSDSCAIQSALQLNVGSAIRLSAAFLSATNGLPADRRILNISSGAGRAAMPGWAVYCATKAALDHYTQVVHAEGHGVRIAAMAPGVIDTGMQADIRTADPAGFPQRDRFVDLHAQGRLSPADATAIRILKRLEHDDFGTPVLDDIRHYTLD